MLDKNIDENLFENIREKYYFWFNGIKLRVDNSLIML